MAQLLPPELLQRIVSLLPEDDDRKVALAVCRNWHAAVAAAPGCWPTIDLCGHLPVADEADVPALADYGLEGLVWYDSDRALSNLGTVAAVPRRAQRVRLRGFWSTVRAPALAHLPCLLVPACLPASQEGSSPLALHHMSRGPCRLPHLRPNTLYGHLALLPAGLTRLELACRRCGPLPAALERFTALQELALMGNGAEVDWAGRGAAGVLAQLTVLCLDAIRSQQLREPGTAVLGIPHGEPSAWKAVGGPGGGFAAAPARGNPRLQL